ncbi:transmembrane protein, putative (macronuclear) [Tetrahymena thermophila SB210]|uniref:Transmembrane protein, putative n=1 Tax=Tetrahymena thermophila (strain SB210) TaxID=312017 RepID=I7LXW4_TETTS|nr:transmembrane protein, putative [Tetrahymena thermophila SB210]EAS06318.2 transmembrane protein, putative [Tetrahymena thermophila SB210]|eukprot:XP_001026563.2 transmembrane protein, putative [Tetrahymena thermophila SB210]
MLNRSTFSQFLSNQLAIIVFVGIYQVLAQSQSACGYGCQNCITDSLTLTSSCQQCNNGFNYYQKANICIYQSCQSNLFYQPLVQRDYSSSGSCVSICSESYYTNFQQNICSPLNQCSQTYSTNQSYSNGQPIQKIVNYKGDYYISIYLGFLNIVSSQDGSFQAQISFPKGYSSIYYFLGEFYLLMQNGSILHWQINSNYLQLVSQIQQGQVTVNSVLLNIQNQYLSAITFNEDNSIIYLTFVAQLNNSQMDVFQFTTQISNKLSKTANQLSTVKLYPYNYQTVDQSQFNGITRSRYGVYKFLSNDFNIVIYDSNNNLTILNSSLNIISQTPISYLNAIQSMYSIPSNPSCIIFIGISNNQSNPNPYILFYFNTATGSITQISSYVLLLQILDISFGSNQRDQYVTITAVVPLSYTFKIFRVFYYINLNINYLALLKYTPTESFLYQVKIPNQIEVNSLYGAQSGFVGINYLNYQYYQQVLNVNSISKSETINNLIQSPSMNLYFIATNFTILVYNLHTDQLLEQLSINSVDQIQGMNIYNNTQILVFNTIKQLNLKNYLTSQSYQLTNFGNITNFAQDQQGQRLYVYGSKLSSYDLTLKNQIDWYTFTSNSGEYITNCLLSTSTIACVSSKNSFIIINLNTQKVQNQIMNSFTGQIQLAQDPQNLNYIIYSSKIQVYSVSGIYIQDFPSYTGGLISFFNFYGSKIVLYSLGYVYIYDRFQYLLNANFLNQGSPALFQSIYIQSQNIMLYFSEEIRYGQIQVYNLQLLISQNSISSNYAQNGIGRIINFSYDPEGSFLQTIDSYGNVMLFLVQATILNDSPLKIIEFDGQTPPQNYQIDLALNQMLIYSPNLVFKANYAQIAQAYVRLYKPNKYSFVEIPNPQNSNGQFIVLDTANTLSYYSNFNSYMINTFDKQNPLMFIQNIQQDNNQFLALVFQNYIQIYNFNQVITQVQSQSYLYQINSVNTVKFLTNNTFLLSNQTIIHYDFNKNIQLSSISLGALNYYKSHLYVEQSSLLFVGLSVGQIIIYNLQTLKPVNIPLQDTSSSVISLILNQVGNQVLIAQKSGSLTIWSLSQSQVAQNIDLQNTFNSVVKLGSELNKLWIDEQFKRIFINFQSSTLIIIADLSSFNLIQFLSFPLSQNNQIKFTPSLIVLQSNAQVNFHNRTSLSLLYYIRKNYRRDQISEIAILDDSIFVVFMIKKIDVFLLDPNSNRPFLIDELIVNFGQLMKLSYIDPTQKFFSVIGQTQNTIFENRYSAYVYLNGGSPVCTQSISIKDAVSAQKQFGLTFNANIVINYLFYLSIYNDLKYMAQINQNSGQFVFKPSNQIQNQLNLYSNIFTFVQGNVTMQNFQFSLPVNDTLQFNANTQFIKFDNIQLSNQTISQAYFNFSNLQSVVINSLSISNLTILQTSDSQNAGLLQFTNIQTVYIYNLQLNQIQIKDFNRVLFSFINVKTLLIQNVTLIGSNSYNFFQMQQINQLTIQNAWIQQNVGLGGQNVTQNSVILQLQGCISTLLQNITFNGNQNSVLIQSSNQNQQSNETIIYRNDIVQFIQSIIQNNTDSFYQYRTESNEGLIQLQTSFVQLSQITYYNNTGNLWIQNSQKVQLTNSNFTENLSFNGGAVKMQNVQGKISINSCQFLKNTALSSGGALFLLEIQSIDADINTLIQYNIALIGGAIRLLNKVLPQMNLNAKMNQNLGNIYGNNIATIPQYVQIIYQNQTQIVEQSQRRNLQNVVNIQNFQSGSILQMGFQFLDQDRKKVSFDPIKIKKQIYPSSIISELIYYQIQVEAPNTTTMQLNGDSLVNYNQYQNNITAFQIQNLQINSMVKSQQILQFVFSTNFYTGQILNFQIQIDFRNCQKGEIMKSISNEIIQCYECPQNSYSIIDPSSYNATNNGVCNKCPEGSLNCFSDQIIPKNGYWLQQGTDLVIYCYNNPSACAPEDESSQQGCSLGHFGPLCEECDNLGKYWNGRRFSSFFGDFNCQECQDNTLQYFFVVGGLIFMVLYLAFQTKRYIDNQKLMQTCFYFRIAKLVPFSKSCFKDQSSFLLKSLIHYLQLSSIILTFKVQFNPQTVYQSAGQPVSKVALNFKCFMSLNTLAKYQMANIQVLIRSLIPFTVFFCLFLVLVLIKLVKKSAVKKYHFFSSMTFCFLFFLPDTIKFITDALSCRQIGNQKYLKIDVSVLCSDESYQNFVLIILIPILVFWLVFPFVMLLLIRKERKTLNSCLTKFSFGNYYAEYKESYYYWEFIKIYLKVIVVFLYTQTEQYGSSSLFLIAVIMTAYIIALQKCQPFQSSNNQFFEIISHGMLIFNMNLSSLSMGFDIQIFDYLLTISHHTFVAIQVIMIIVVIAKDGSGAINKFAIRFINILKINYLMKYFQANQQTNYEVFRRWKKVYGNLSLLTELKALNQISQLQVKRQNTPQQKKQGAYNYLQRQVTQAREISDSITNGMITNIIHQSSIHAKQFISPRSIQKVNSDLIVNSQFPVNVIRSGIIEDSPSQFQSNFCLEPLTSDKHNNGKLVLSQYHPKENSQFLLQNQGSQSNRDIQYFKTNFIESPRMDKPQEQEIQSKYDQESSSKNDQEPQNESEIDIEQENQTNSCSPVQNLKMQYFKTIKK